MCIRDRILPARMLHSKGPRPKPGMVVVPAFAPFSRVIKCRYCCPCQGSPCMPSTMGHIPLSSSWAQWTVIATPDRRKTKRVCHVNLLKPYHDREPGLDPAVASIPVNVLLHLSVTECPAPTPCSRQLLVATRNATPQWRRRRRFNFGCPNL